MIDLKNKEAYTLNLPEKLLLLSVKNAKEKIAEIEARKERFQPGLDLKRQHYEACKTEYYKVKEAYMAVVAEYQAMDDEIRDQQTLAHSYKIFNNSTSHEKRLQILVNNKNIPANTEKKQNIRWVTEAAKVLEKQDRFLSVDELWNFFSKDQELIERSKNNITPFKYCKPAASKTIISSATNEFKGGRGHIKTLVFYNDKIGLTHWVDKDGRPKDKYIEVFMFKAS